MISEGPCVTGDLQHNIAFIPTVARRPININQGLFLEVIPISLSPLRLLLPLTVPANGNTVIVLPFDDLMHG